MQQRRTCGAEVGGGPSGALPQCDAWRPLRLPGVLVGCGRLGGISSTVSAHETLALRGYDTAAVVLLGDALGNAAALRRHLGLPVLSLPGCTAPPARPRCEPACWRPGTPVWPAPVLAGQACLDPEQDGCPLPAALGPGRGPSGGGFCVSAGDCCT